MMFEDLLIESANVHANPPALYNGAIRHRRELACVQDRTLIHDCLTAPTLCSTLFRLINGVANVVNVE